MAEYAECALLQSAASLLNTFYAARMLDPLFIGQWSPEVQAILPPEMLPRFAQNESAMLLAARVGGLAPETALADNLLLSIT